MTLPVELPGLDFLISVCRSHDLRVELRPPQAEALRPGGALLGQPFDPLLRAMLSRFNGGILGEMFLFPATKSSDGLEPFNASIREGSEERLREVLRYGSFLGFDYYLATVPSLADGDGVQPVVYLNLHEGVEMLPIASSVDRAFDLYARYLGALVGRYGSIEAAEEEGLELFFPRSIPDLVARDSRLLHMLERKQFDFLAAGDKRSTDWIARVLREAQRLT